MGRPSARAKAARRALALFLLPLAVSCMSAHDEPGPPKASSVRSALTVGQLWAPAAPPIQIRNGHTATLLGDGTVLIAGGGSPATSTEIASPYSGTTIPGPSLGVARTHHTATMLLSGKVLVAGGEGTSSAELYDPTTRGFSPTGSMTRVRSWHSAVRLPSGKVLIAGTVPAPGGDPDATAEIYDPASGTFTATSARTTVGRGGLVLLSSGKALLVTDDVDLPDPSKAETFDPATGAWTSVNPPVAPDVTQLEDRIGVLQSLTRLHDGRVALANTALCMGVGGGEPNCTSLTRVFDPSGAGGAGTYTMGPKFGDGRATMTAALLLDGRVDFVGVGSMSNLRTAETLEPASLGNAFLTPDGNATVAHRDPTATLMPGGDVFVVGGPQATNDVRIWPGIVRAASTQLSTGRESHAATRLHDGRVLIVGGIQYAQPPALPRDAELFDPVSETFSDPGAATVSRVRPSLTTLANGKVLVTGGYADPPTAFPPPSIATAEIFDPAASAGARFKAIASMTATRIYHAAVLLPTGHVLVTGGCSTGDCNQSALDSAELFDPVTETFTPLPKMKAKRGRHGSVLLPNGKVLVVGDGNPELYDPASRTFTEAAPSGAQREGTTARLLPSGKVFVAGGPAQAVELYDPVANTWAFGAVLDEPAALRTVATRPDGRVLLTAGRQPSGLVNNRPLVFDPMGGPGGAFALVSAGADTYDSNTFTLTGTGEVLIAGGNPCVGGCLNFPQQAAILFGDGAPPEQRPTITSAPAVVTAGTTVTIAGTGFTSGPEASTGRTSASAVNHPIVYWVSPSDAVVPGTILDFTDTSATWRVPATALYGHGVLFVASSGAMSRGVPVEIKPAAPAAACRFDAECALGFCVDGVCCDRRCDGKCEGCSAARKKSGADGVCGPVPPGDDSLGVCFLDRGDACTSASACKTGFCAQGVCCDAACTGECQSCNQAQSKGTCSSINEGICTAVCDGDHTLQQVGTPGVDCTPFKCEGPRCKTSCASARDCVAPFVCSEGGQCVSPAAPSPGDASVFGCAAAPIDRRAGAAWLGVALGLVAAAARRRGREVRR